MTPTAFAAAVAALTGDVQALARELGYGRSTIYAKLRGDSDVSQDVAERITALLRQRRDEIDAAIEKIAH
jgi:plasmid maintenance system antidote protein VapI